MAGLKCRLVTEGQGIKWDGLSPCGNSSRRTMAKLNELSFEEVLGGLKNHSLIYVDIRNPDELIQDGKVAGSVNLPLPEIEQALSLTEDDFERKYGFKKPAQNDSNIVIACRSGRRVLSAVDQLTRKGYSSFKVYLGSFLDWKAKGGPLDQQQ